jgi:hypothetical protein
VTAGETTSTESAYADLPIARLRERYSEMAKAFSKLPEDDKNAIRRERNLIAAQRNEHVAITSRQSMVDWLLAHDKIMAPKPESVESLLPDSVRKMLRDINQAIDSKQEDDQT